MDFDKIFTILSSHWPFLAVAILLGVVGEVVKGIILGKDKASMESTRFKRFYIKTLPLHPVLSGALLGLVLATTIPDVVSTGGVVSSILYFALSGALSSSIYNTLKSLKPRIAQALRNKVASYAGPAARAEKAESEEEPQDGV